MGGGRRHHEVSNICGVPPPQTACEPPAPPVTRQCSEEAHVDSSAPGPNHRQAHRGGGDHRGWDHHSNVQKYLPTLAKQTDQGSAALIADLKQRDMLDETLVIWAGEFGRTPHSSGRDGRDHHPEGFTVWLAGGGVKGGVVHGATDELGMHAVENVCTMHDLHATILHLIGLDHERLTFRHGGRDFRLTDVHGNVIREVLA